MPGKKNIAKFNSKELDLMVSAIKNQMIEELTKEKNLERFKNNQLLEMILEIMDTLEYSYGYPTNEDRNEMLLRNCPFLYEIYKRFYLNKGKKVDYLDSKENQLAFWASPLAPYLLLTALRTDGYLRNRFKEKSYRERFYASTKRT
jgi:hypothetical protein